MTDVGGSELLEQIERGRAPFILDVRSHAEYKAGHVPGAINVPFWLVPFRAGSLPVEPNAAVIVYCGHGPRALLARAALRASGFTRVACLAGHWSEWNAAGRRIERSLRGA
jgi:rhodanese-related sulfurtransferase